MNRLVECSAILPRAAVRTVSQQVGFGVNATDEEGAASEYAAAKPYEEIPGPKPLPLIGNIWRYTPLIGEYSFKRLHKTYQKMFRQYGPLVRERVFGKRELVHCFDATDMWAVYMHRVEWPQRQTHQALKKYRKERPHKFKNPGVFLSNGKEWSRMRQTFSPIVSREPVAERYTNVLEEITSELVDKIKEITDDKGEVDFQPWLFKWAIECIAAVVLDRRLGCLTRNNMTAEKLVKAAHDTHQGVFITEVSPFYKYFKTRTYAKLEAAQDYVGSMVEKFLSTDDMGPNAMMRQLMSLEKADYKEVYSMALDMFLAGIDTTSYTTAFGLYNLAKNDRVQVKLRHQLVQRLPQKNSPLSDKIADFTYLHSVMEESLRLNPVAFGNGRVLTRNLVLSGFKVPKGTQVILQHQAASLNEAYFTRPTEFIPERHTDDGYERNALNHVVSAPFGFGGRPCMGRRLAEREMMLLFGKLIRSYKISYHYEDIDCFNRLVNVPDKPLRLRFHPVPN